MDARGRRTKRVSLGTKLPREDGGQRAQYAERRVPSHDVAQQKVWEEWDRAFRLNPFLDSLLHSGRNAHPKPLHKQQVKREKQRCKPREHGDMKPEEAGQRCASRSEEHTS